MEEKVELGIITKPFGIKGEMIIKPFANNPINLIDANKVWIDEKIYDLSNCRNGHNKLIVKFKNIDNIDDVIPLRGKIVSVQSNSLKELEDNNYYHYQIIGSTVIDKKIGDIGKVIEIIETGSNDVYVILKNKSEYLIPASKKNILNIDLTNKIILVDLPENLSH